MIQEGCDELKTVELNSMPKLKFAHVYQADRYFHVFCKNQEYIEVCYIAEGKVFFEKNGKTFLAEKGDVVCCLLDSGVTVKTEEFHCHHTVSSMVKWEYSESGLHLPVLTKASAKTKEIETMIDEYIYKPYLYENSITRSANLFINILCKIDFLNQDNTGKDGTFLLTERAKKYIHRYLHNPLTQTEIAEYLGISCGYLCNIFQKNEGTTVMKYINTAKMKGIESLMDKEGMKLYKAAEMYGFSDPNYVSSLYKKLFGRNITDKPTSYL